MIKKIKDIGIKDAKFIVIPKIYDDELLSSWFVRVSYAHHTHPHTFLNLHLHKAPQSLSANNFDIVLSNEELLKLQYKCSNENNLYNATLKSYNGYLQEKIINNGFNKLICPLRFCPICLREDRIIYFRKHWKVVFNTVCERHRCFLYDSCPKCNKSLDITKMFKNKLSFKYCHKCGCDLTKAKRLSINQKSLNGYTTVKFLNKILRRGFVSLDEHFVYSFHFFDCLLQLCKKILKHRKVLFVNQRYLFKYLELRKLSNKQSVIHQLTIKEQYALFSLAYYLFENYPKNLKSYIKINKLSHWSILKDMDYVPFWFESIITLFSPRYVPISKILTREEIKNGRAYLKSKSLTINKANMSRLFGCSFFSVYNKLYIEEDTK